MSVLSPSGLADSVIDPSVTTSAVRNKYLANVSQQNPVSLQHSTPSSPKPACDQLAFERSEFEESHSLSNLDQDDDDVVIESSEEEILAYSMLGQNIWCYIAIIMVVHAVC